LTAQDEARYMAQNRDFSLHRLHSMPISKSRSTRIFVSDAVGVCDMSNSQWWNSLYNRRNYLLKQNDHDCCTTVCKAYTCSQVLSSLIQRNAVRLQVSRFRHMGLSIQLTATRCFHSRRCLWTRLVAWYSGRTLVFDRRSFPVMRSTYSWWMTT